MKPANLLFVAMLAVLSGSMVFAQDDESAVKTRIQQRVAQVDQLKVAGVVGENNKGFLEQRGQMSAQQTQIMNAENSDRRALYNIIASRLNLAVAVVGEQRAESLRNNSARGVWLQKPPPDNGWYQK